MNSLTRFVIADATCWHEPGTIEHVGTAPAFIQVVRIGILIVITLIRLVTFTAATVLLRLWLNLIQIFFCKKSPVRQQSLIDCTQLINREQLIANPSLAFT
jgi:hypothetical protein